MNASNSWSRRFSFVRKSFIFIFILFLFKKRKPIESYNDLLSCGAFWLGWFGNWLGWDWLVLCPNNTDVTKFMKNWKVETIWEKILAVGMAVCEVVFKEAACRKKIYVCIWTIWRKIEKAKKKRKRKKWKMKKWKNENEKTLRISVPLGATPTCSRVNSSSSVLKCLMGKLVENI